MQFLQEEELMFNDTTKDSNEEILQVNEVLDNSKSDKWNGLKPCMRFFHFMLEDDVVIACRSTNNWENREGIDGRNSFSRPKTF